MKAVHLYIASFAVASLCAVGCGSNNNTTTDSDSDSAGGTPTASSADVLMAQDSVQSADDAAATDNTASGYGPATPPFKLADDVVRSLFTEVSTDINTTFHVFDCNATVLGVASDVNNVWTMDANLTFDTNSCTGSRQISGAASITATWDANVTDKRTVDVSSDFNTTFADGSHLAYTALDATLGYSAQLQATGVPSDGNTTVIATLNEHHVFYGPQGTVLYDHNVTTPTPVTVDSNFSVADGNVTPVSRTLVSGEVDVHHNLAHFLARHTFTNLVHDLTGNCTCPSSGSLVQDVSLDSGKGSYTRTYAFTGCGAATVTTSATSLSGTTQGSVDITWSDCTN